MPAKKRRAETPWRPRKARGRLRPRLGQRRRHPPRPLSHREEGLWNRGPSPTKGKARGTRPTPKERTASTKGRRLQRQRLQRARRRRRPKTPSLGQTVAASWHSKKKSCGPGRPAVWSGRAGRSTLPFGPRPNGQRVGSIHVFLDYLAIRWRCGPAVAAAEPPLKGAAPETWQNRRGRPPPRRGSAPTATAAARQRQRVGTRPLQGCWRGHLRMQRTGEGGRSTGGATERRPRSGPRRAERPRGRRRRGSAHCPEAAIARAGPLLSRWGRGKGPWRT